MAYDLCSGKHYDLLSLTKGNGTCFTKNQGGCRRQQLLKNKQAPIYSEAKQKSQLKGKGKE